MIDETTGLRNRIAELESLVRELRGMSLLSRIFSRLTNSNRQAASTMGWADSSFRDGDPNEKWHSRATKCAPLAKRRHSPDAARNGTNPGRGVLPSLLTPIKIETATKPKSQLYRFSPSPPLTLPSAALLRRSSGPIVTLCPRKRARFIFYERHKRALPRDLFRLLHASGSTHGGT